MLRFFVTLFLFAVAIPFVNAEDSQQAQRYVKEAEYYQRQAESYRSDAESYLRKAKSAESDAAYYLRNKRYDKARDCCRKAADAMDNYQNWLNSACNSASKAEDYLRKAANALD